MTPERFQKRTPSASPLVGTDEDLTVAAQEFLRAYGHKRFFLYLHLADTHVPHLPLPEARALLAADVPADYPPGALHDESERLLAGGTPRPQVDPALGRAMSDMYDACVRTGDHGLGAVLDRLAALGLQDETVVVFTSDHGEAFWEHGIAEHLLWFYTPMAVPFTCHLRPQAVVYDCMDELSAFAGAPQAMREREMQLMAWADLVFTGGQSLYEAKRDRHPQVHAFPSSIDRSHFAQARRPGIAQPADQAGIHGPRIGFFGVVDERFDSALLDGLAALRPQWNFIIIGPVVKIDPGSLPRRPNIHYLGKKEYRELPAYLAGWDAAMLPFARNESTRYISPTKTPEYLSAGRPVVSTSITDVIRPYGERGLVRIADEPVAFARALADAMAEATDPRWVEEVDGFLAGLSWDRTWEDMRLLLERSLRGKHARSSLIAAA